MAARHPDHERVVAANEGDTAAIDWVTERLRQVPRWMAQLARRTGGWTSHDVEDAAAEAVRAALTSLARYHGLAPFDSWLYTICTNTLRSQARRRRLRAALPLATEVVDPGHTPATAAAAAEVAAALRGGCDAIGGAEAEVLRLRYMGGLDFRDISARLGIPMAAVRTRHYRALAKLKQRLEAWDGEQEPAP
ncbi:MAG: sigma-70 family RNA polymerase sigma factor [Planctomycetes bacterium]|nr:sigma-70 family RNA polymerase sigma factor [Planctomycetota bacterium]